jgi:hypothetical protein
MIELMGHLLPPVKPYWPARAVLLLLAWENLAILAIKLLPPWRVPGTPAFFVHPGEASHGDLGMITKNDVVLALSNSGNTAEVITLLPLIKRLGIPLVSMTGDTNSALAQAAVANLDVGIAEEACPFEPSTNDKYHGNTCYGRRTGYCPT